MSKTAWSGPSAGETETREEPPEISAGFAGLAPGATWRVVLALALPVLAQQFFLLTVNLSDRFLAGHLQPLTPEQQAQASALQLLAIGQLGETRTGGGLGSVLAAEASWEMTRQATALHGAFQAAQTTSNYLAWFINSYAVLVSVGSTALVARFIGAGSRRLAIRATHQSLLLAAFLGVAGSAIGLLGVHHLVWLLRLRDDAAQLAAAYLSPLFWLLVFQIVETAGIACLVGAGDTRTGLWVTMGVAAINLPLAWSFFLLGTEPETRFVGIAVGTGLSHVLGALVVLFVLWRGRAGLFFRPRWLRLDWGLMQRLLRVSVPAGVDSLSLATCQLWFLSIVNRLGNVAGSAHGIALTWEALAYLSGGAFGTAAMSLIGRNLGAGRPRQAARSGWLAFGMGCGLMSVMGLVFFFLARPMFTLFCPQPEQQPIVEAGVPVLRLIAFAIPAMACTVILPSALRGAGDTRVPVLFTWTGFLLVRIPLACYLTMSQLDLGPLGEWRGANLGLMGAWIAMCADLVIRGGLLLHRFARGRWKLIQV